MTPSGSSRPPRRGAAAIDDAMRDFHVESLRGGAVDAESLARLLDTPPMLAERRAVVLRDAHALRKAARQALDRYLARPAADLLLLLVLPAGQKEDAALARLATDCPFDPLTPDQVRRWIAHHAEQALGATVSDGAASLLQQAVGSDLQALAAELDKCVSYALGAGAEARTTMSGAEARDGDAPAGDAPEAAPRPLVDEAAVTAVVGMRRGETVSDLLDAVAMRDTATAVALVPFVLGQPKVTGVQVVMALGTQVLALSWGRAQRDAGTPPGQLAREYFTFLKQTGAYPGRPWGEAASAWTKAVERWTPDALRAARRLVLDADAALKETRFSSDDQLLQSLVLALGATGAPRRGRARGRAA